MKRNKEESKMIRVYQVIEEDLKTNDSWVMYEGTSLKEAEEALDEDYIKKGYILTTLVNDLDEVSDYLFISEDVNHEIIKVKGWDL